MANHLVLVAGNIGAGKTSLTERLAARLNWQSGFESVADNPYISDFYANMRAWSFHLQVFFLGHRAAQHKAMAAGPRNAIIDRSIYEDAFIFARALHEMGNLNERDHLAYRRLYDLVVDSLPAHDLLIYMLAPVEVSVARIPRRAGPAPAGAASLPTRVRKCVQRSKSASPRLGHLLRRWRPYRAAPGSCHRRVSVYGREHVRGPRNA